MNKKTPRIYEVCSLCNHQTAELTRRSQIVGKGAKQVIVENVPMYHCRHCGGTYFTRAVALALEEIRLHPEIHTQHKSFATASLEVV
jgi:YgiT-type zinc finger domain-containing protein